MELKQVDREGKQTRGQQEGGEAKPGQREPYLEEERDFLPP